MQGSCDSINELIDDHLQHVQRRIAELQALESQLVELRSHCDAVRATRDCGILRELEHSALAPQVSSGCTHIGGCHSQK